MEAEVEVEEYLHHHQVEVEAEAEVEEVEEVPPEDHPLPMEDSKETPPLNSQEIGKEAKHLC